MALSVFRLSGGGYTVLSLIGGEPVHLIEYVPASPQQSGLETSYAAHGQDGGELSGVARQNVSEQCRLLILSTNPAQTIEAIERFVKHGGGLLMIGDHTNVFKSSTYLNDVARQLGFTYRNDLLFHVGDPYEQPYRAAAVVHPAVAHVDKLDLAVSCSIDPGLNWGRAAMTGRGLWNLQADYQTSNYHPPAEYRPEMRVGPFVQLWATRYEKGRVLAFTDSTIFSNFCTFQPGKAELMLNMLGWLNHRSFWDERLHWLLLVVPVGVVGLILLTVAAFAGRKMQGGWLFVLAAGLFGAAACCWTVTAVARVAMPYPAEIRQPSRFTIDRNVSDVPLSKGAYIQGDGEGFGLFEQWIPRLDHFTARREGDDVFSGEALVVDIHLSYSREDVERVMITEALVEESVHSVDSPLRHFGIGSFFADRGQFFEKLIHSFRHDFPLFPGLRFEKGVASLHSLVSPEPARLFFVRIL